MIFNEFSSYFKRNLKGISYRKDISSSRFFKRNSYFFETKVELNSTEDIARTKYSATK